MKSPASAFIICQFDPSIREIYFSMFLSYLSCLLKHPPFYTFLFYDLYLSLHCYRGYAKSFEKKWWGKVGESTYAMGVQNKCTRAYKGEGVE